MYKSSSPPAVHSYNEIFTTKQLLGPHLIKFTGVLVAPHRTANAVVESCTSGVVRDDASGNSKVAEIRLVFDTSPSQPTTVPVIGRHRKAHQNAVTRPHTTDWGFPDRVVLPRKPVTRSGMKPLAKHAGMWIFSMYHVICSVNHVIYTLYHVIYSVDLLMYSVWIM